MGAVSRFDNVAAWDPYFLEEFGDLSPEDSNKEDDPHALKEKAALPLPSSISSVPLPPPIPLPSSISSPISPLSTPLDLSNDDDEMAVWDPYFMEKFEDLSPGDCVKKEADLDSDDESSPSLEQKVSWPSLSSFSISSLLLPGPNRLGLSKSRGSDLLKKATILSSSAPLPPRRDLDNSSFNEAFLKLEISQPKKRKAQNKSSSAHPQVDKGHLRDLNPTKTNGKKLHKPK